MLCTLVNGKARNEGLISKNNNYKNNNSNLIFFSERKNCLLLQSTFSLLLIAYFAILFVDASTFYTPLYGIEYSVQCTVIHVWPGWDGCRKLGPEWGLASAVTAEDNENIKGILPAPAWLSGSKLTAPNDPDAVDWSLYTWHGGRAEGIAFASYISCLPGAYCNFAPGQSLSNSYINPSVYMTMDGRWSLENGYCWAPVCGPVSCLVCERSPCNYTVDCFKDGALSLNGYYPSCNCTCKNGFHGKKCDTVTDSGSKSDYAIVCNNTVNGVVTFEGAMSGCKTYGDDWSLATVASAEANTMLKMFASHTAWLGGSSSGNSGSWRWLNGRFSGAEFYKEGGSGVKLFSSWTKGRPKNETCGSEKREFLTITNGTWIDAYGVSTTCAGAPALPKCYICERQPCIFSTDCNVSNSYNVTGYYPKCNCTCKEGWGGSTCDLNNTIYNGLHFSEYKVQCFAEGLNFSVLGSVCARLGPGYVLASIPTKAVNDFITNSSHERIWTGAVMNSNVNFPGYTGDQWYWESITRVGRHFASNSSCLSGAYCNFNPNETLAQGWYGDQKRRIVINGSAFPVSFTRYWDLTTEFLDCLKKTKCVACERSFCSIDLDCTTNATVQVDGYYPNCQCTCKFGRFGDRCEINSLVNFGNYSSTFSVSCSEWPLEFKDPFDYCAQKGPGWMPATAPNKEAHDLISNFSRDNGIWLAGSDVEVVGEWKWRAGRLNGTVFYANSTCVGNFYCPWDSAQPAHVSNYCPPILQNVSTDYLFLQSGKGERHWRAGYDDIWCYKDTLPKCYACELSICGLNDDCNSSGTINVSGYYPSCQCSCKNGYEGPRCDKRLCSIEADCHGRATNVTGTYPNCTCIGCPRGYRTPDCSRRSETLTPALISCPLYVKTCKKDGVRGVTVLNPMYISNLSLNGLTSTFNIGMAVVLPMPYVITAYNYTYRLIIYENGKGVSSALYVNETVVRENAIISTVFYNTQYETNFSQLYLHLLSATDLIENCCPNYYYDKSHSYFSANSVNDTFRIGELKLLPHVPLPKSDKPFTYSDDKAQQAERALMQQTSNGTSPNDEDFSELFGPHTDRVVLRALSPFALIINFNDDGYSGIIVFNLIIITVITTMHLCVVIAFKRYSKYSFHEACAAVSFPSMPIYVVYALLPGTAVAAGELVAKLSGIGFLGFVILLVAFITSFAVPYLCLSRALFELPLLDGRIRSRVELLFPTTVIEPKEVRGMWGAMIGNIRSYMPLWPTLPVWSSVLLFIFALIQPQSSTAGKALYVVLAILHCLLILIILLTRPLLSMSLNVLYALGILPTVLLCITLAATAGTDSYVTGTAPRVLLILFTIVNAARLAIAIASPLRVFDISYSRILLDSPVWTYTAHYFNGEKKISYSRDTV